MPTREVNIIQHTFYHFIEKELEAIDITDRDSWEDTRINNSNTKLSY